MKNLLNPIKKCERKTKRFVVKKGLLSSYLTRFIAFFARHPYFRCTKNLTIGFAIGRIEFKNTGIAISFFR